MANAVPLAPTLLAPGDLVYVPVDEPIVFAWTFVDPGDTQSQASLRYKRDDAAGGVWTTLTDVVTTPTTYTMAAGVLSSTPAHLYEWQVQTKDSVGQVSPWSASKAFVPGSSLPAPVGGGPGAATASPTEVHWTIPAVPAGITQDAYRVTIKADGVVVYDSGVVESITTRSVMVPWPTGDTRAWAINVQYRHVGAWSGTWSAAMLNLILPPERPLLVLSQTPGMRPEIVVSITNPAASDAGHLPAVSNDITRDGVRIAAGLPVNVTFTDRLPGAGAVTYVCTAKTANGGTAQSF